MITKIYGIKNCNTMKKTFDLFETAGHSYEFIDYKKNAPDEKLLSDFVDKLGLDTVVNKLGMTFRKLNEEEKRAMDDKKQAIAILKDKSSMIKRPIIQFENGELLAGLEEERILEKLK
ncbi:Spx/MgsR family RNA polymerase-binding regulatory protein [Negadavirga shengliensis]|uniref:Spx/MgsR family RNA polymerase-binding regulatory protein n=1 Tax=Negadavirga shengliensis TaxID=1389218 RepID=A0ABV9T6F2_9BACT